MSGLEKRCKRRGLVANARESRAKSEEKGPLSMYIWYWRKRLFGHVR